MCMYTIVFLQTQTGGVFLGFVTNNSSEFPFTLHLFAFYYVHIYTVNVRVLSWQLITMTTTRLSWYLKGSGWNAHVLHSIYQKSPQ